MGHVLQRAGNATRRDHGRVRELLCRVGSPDQQEFFESEVLAGRVFAATYRALRPTSRREFEHDDSDAEIRDSDIRDSRELDEAGVRLEPRRGGGQQLRGSQQAPAGVGAADWVLVEICDSGRLLAAVLPLDAPGLSLSRGSGPVTLRLAGVRVLRSWLLTGWPADVLTCAA